MSDFSLTARCPFCRSRFAPDDGYCDCSGSQDYLDSLQDPDVKKMLEEKKAEDRLIRRVFKRRHRKVSVE